MEPSVKACPSCEALLPNVAVFCSDCGAYQGQPGIDDRPSSAVAPSVDLTAQPRGLRRGLCICPHCGATVSDLAMACTNCFRALTPIAPLSGPELKPPSRSLWWILMAAGTILTAALFADEVFNFVQVFQH